MAKKAFKREVGAKEGRNTLVVCRRVVVISTRKREILAIVQRFHIYSTTNIPFLDSSDVPG